MFHISVWGAWSFVWGAKPTKAPSGDGTATQMENTPGFEKQKNCDFLNIVTLQELVK